MYGSSLQEVMFLSGKIDVALDITVAIQHSPKRRPRRVKRQIWAQVLNLTAVVASLA
jgi:hypothetical protein